ncbi:hypothetical protein [Protofrankia symbiont of Coriaria ruscifolia]|uniref:hypothetical protein n=1 Tax=Protofrankia symbiont of Coriaria ruscifolia TaxID=1306542 RepID=UPI0010410F64|nr:hypothetical protein [Protofrankia symbiont of Coriaria ruscifolia]
MTAATGSDPLARLTALPGVPDAVTAARSSIDALLRHRVMRRGSAKVTAEVSLRAARASAALEGYDVGLETLRAHLGRDLSMAAFSTGSPTGTGSPTDTDFPADAGSPADTGGAAMSGPTGEESAGNAAYTSVTLDTSVTLGAVRLYAELGTLRGAWERAPRQALARMHVLAAHGLVADTDLGRPRMSDRFASPSAAIVPAGQPASVSAGQTASGGAHAPVIVAGSADPTDPLGLGPAPSPTETAARLSGLTELLLARTSAPAIVVAAIVEGELLTIRPFGTFDGIIARAAGRLVLISRGLDPKAVTATEVGHIESGRIATGETATGDTTTSVYAGAARAYAAAGAEGVSQWIIYYARALELGARESLAICEAVARAN